MSNIHLGVSEAHILKAIITNNNALSHLILYGNAFGVEGARILSEGLKVNHGLQLLDIGCNRIRNKGATAIANGILGMGSESRLRVLSVKNNFINEKGFKQF